MQISQGQREHFGNDAPPVRWTVGATYRRRDAGFVLSRTKGTATEYSDARKAPCALVRYADSPISRTHSDGQRERDLEIPHGRGTTDEK
jgi:hypothetical protein